MITLYGLPLSPFYNKVKIALFEKGVNFEEVLVRPSQAPEVLQHSPMGKIPWVDINGMALSESTAIVEWLEDAYPTAALMPPTPNGRARVRQMMSMWDLYVVPACMPVTRHRIFGAPLDDAARSDAQAAIARALKAVARLARFTPWLVDEAFTLADAAAAGALPMVELAGEVLDVDLLADLPGVGEYRQLLLRRQSVLRSWNDRSAVLAQMLEQAAKQSAV